MTDHREATLWGRKKERLAQLYKMQKDSVTKVEDGKKRTTERMAAYRLGECIENEFRRDVFWCGKMKTKWNSVTLREKCYKFGFKLQDCEDRILNMTIPYACRRADHGIGR